MDSRKVASELIELSGGTSNIKNVTHCSTRLRFIIKDKSAVEVEAIKKCEGVLGVVFTTDELQMVFGKNVIPVYTEASKIYEAAGNKAGGVVPDEAPAKEVGQGRKEECKDHCKQRGWFCFGIGHSADPRSGFGRYAQGVPAAGNAGIPGIQGCFCLYAAQPAGKRSVLLHAGVCCLRCCQEAGAAPRCMQ